MDNHVTDKIIDLKTSVESIKTQSSKFKKEIFPRVVCREGEDELTLREGEVDTLRSIISFANMEVFRCRLLFVDRQTILKVMEEE